VILGARTSTSNEEASMSTETSGRPNPWCERTEEHDCGQAAEDATGITIMVNDHGERSGTISIRTCIPDTLADVREQA
jgi:hypothetical protein